MTKSSRFACLSFLFGAAGLAFATGCKGIAPPGTKQASEVVRHSVAVSEANALIAEARISLSRPARVFVEYDNPLAGRYRTAIGAAAAAHTIPIVRLRPETTYDYTVFTVDGPDASDAVRGPGGSFTTGALPEPLAQISTLASGRSSQPLILTDWAMMRGASFFVFRDEVGAVVWYVRVERAGPVARGKGGNFVFIPQSEGRLSRFTPLGEVTDLAVVGRAHHDLVVLDGGRVLFPITRTLRHDGATGGGSHTELPYDVLGIWHAASDSVEQVWSAKESWDILDPKQHWRPMATDNQTSWTHVNSVSIGPLGNVVLSLRNRNEVVSLTPDYEIEWQLFGPDSDYVFPDPADRFYGQHTASQLANGNILLFDNGYLRPEAEGGAYSRALELRLDDAAGTAAKVWEYRPDPDIYAPILSSAYRLDNGNTLVNFGSRPEAYPIRARDIGSGLRGPVVLAEADANGDEVFRVETVHLDSRSAQYRAHGGFEAIRGEAMLRPPTGRDRQSAEPLTMRYERLTHVATGPFDLYLGGDGRLVYAKHPCEAGDVALRFFVHVHPKEREDLPADRRGAGFDNLDFEFVDIGMLWKGRCHAELRLPEYAIDHIKTGQYAAEGEAVGHDGPNGSPAATPWNVEIRPPP